MRCDASKTQKQNKKRAKRKARKNKSWQTKSKWAEGARGAIRKLDTAVAAAYEEAENANVAKDNENVGEANTQMPFINAAHAHAHAHTHIDTRAWPTVPVFVGGLGVQLTTLMTSSMSLSY